MDRGEILRQVALGEAIAAAEEARAASRARAEATVNNIPDEELMRVADALSEDLMARAERLYNLEEDHPAVVSSRVPSDQRSELAFTLSTTTLASDGVGLSIIKHEVKGQPDNYLYALFFPPHEANWYSQDGKDEISKNSLSFYETPLSKRSTYHVREKLVQFVEIAESLSVVEEAFGIEQQPDEDRAWLGQVLLGGQSSQEQEY